MVVEHFRGQLAGYKVAGYKVPKSVFPISASEVPVSAWRNFLRRARGRHGSPAGPRDCFEDRFRSHPSLSSMPDTVEVDLGGTVVLVTGAARRAGRSVATTLAHHGARLVLTARDADALAETADLCGGVAATVVADLDDPASALRVAEAATAAFGSVDALVNNAGIGMATHWPGFWSEPVRFWAISRNDYECYLRVNLLAGLDLARLLVPPMIVRGWGRIINVTTSLGTMLAAGQGPYAVSKAGLEAITAVQAADLVGTGVTANAVTTGVQRLRDLSPMR